MPWSGSGSYSPVYIWSNDAANGIKILASRQDTQWADICTNGFGNTLTRDGQGSATANLPMNGHKFTGLGNGSASTDSAAFGQITSAVGALTSYIGGLTLSTAGGSGTFGIATGSAVDSTNALMMNFASAFTKTTAVWALGAGVGALDTGVVTTSTWYHVFLIGDPLLPPDVLFSLSATSPMLPSGYSVFRRIGSMKTDGSSHWVFFIQSGNRFMWGTPVQDVNSSTSGATTAITQTLSVPTGVAVTANTSMIVQATISNSATLYASALTQTDVAASATSAFSIFAVASNPNQFDSAPISVLTNTSAQIRIRFSAADTVYYINTQGWIDPRGTS